MTAADAAIRAAYAEASTLLHHPAPSEFIEPVVRAALTAYDANRRPEWAEVARSADARARILTILRDEMAALTDGFLERVADAVLADLTTPTLTGATS